MAIANGETTTRRFARLVGMSERLLVQGMSRVALPPARFTGQPSIIRRQPAPRGPVSSSLASGVMMTPGLIVFSRAPRTPHLFAASHMTRGALPRFDSW